jgi:hypothetical protein
MDRCNLDFSVADYLLDAIVAKLLKDRGSHMSL